MRSSNCGRAPDRAHRLARSFPFAARNVIDVGGFEMAWWMNKIATLGACAGALGLVQTARAETPVPAEWLDAKVNESGQHCEKHAEQRDGKRLLVACGAAGVWELAVDEPTPRLVRSYGFSGDVIGFFTEPDGRLWVKVQVLEAHPFASPRGATRLADSAFPSPLPAASPAESAPPAVPPPTVATPPATAPRRAGRVTRSLPGEVVVSLGTADTVVPGDHIELVLQHPEKAADGDVPLVRELVAVGQVADVSVYSARVRLGLNENVPVGALASPSRSSLTSSLTAPPRVSDLWTLEVIARPFAALGELGGGVLLSGAFGRRIGNLHLQALVDPLAYGDVANKRHVTAANAALIASYDSQYFEMGLGFGGQTVNAPDFLLNAGSGLAALQLIRLGAQDGLNISARTNVVLFHSQFKFGGMVGIGQIPVTRGYWLLLNGGGGDIGYGYGELGLRVLLSGNGRAGSKFLTVTAGGAAVFRSTTCDAFFTCDQAVTYGGPMAGVGGEWRF